MHSIRGYSQDENIHIRLEASAGASRSRSPGPGSDGCTTRLTHAAYGKPTLQPKRTPFQARPTAAMTGYSPEEGW